MCLKQIMTLVIDPTKSNKLVLFYLDEKESVTTNIPNNKKMIMTT